MIRAGITGAAGYTGGELIRLLLNHPEVEIAFAHSKSNGGKPVNSVHGDLLGSTEMLFSTEINPDADVLFLCGGHGEGLKFMQQHELSAGTKVVDLAQDFRLAEHAAMAGRNFIYGLPEMNKAAIAAADSVANPGCFATAITLALLPLAKAGGLQHDVVIQATTGATGAGQSLSASSHFSNRMQNLSNYKVFEHQHLAEIKESLFSSAAPVHLAFVPQRGAFTRGILANCVVKTDKTAAELYEMYEAYYKDAAFTHVTSHELYLKQVVNTNNCYVHITVQDGYALVSSVLDNLLKGASGQAVQNMNIMFGLPEKQGLQLKAAAF